MNTITTDWTRVSPGALTLWYQKLAYHRFDEDLTSDELKARDTYRIITAILDLADPPSVQGYYYKVISEYHREWLTKLPLFERIGYIEAFRTFSDNRLVHRLWLLSDWITSADQIRQRKQQHQEQTQEWLRQRVAFWFVYQRLRSLNIAHDKVAGILQSAFQGQSTGIPESIMFLNNLGYVQPSMISDTDINDFLRDFRFKSGHVYQDVWDFVQG